MTVMTARPEQVFAFAALVLGLTLPLASLPPFELGYWVKAEPLVIGFHTGGALATLAAAIALWRDPATAPHRLAHPYVVLPLALGLWSTVAAPATGLSLLSLFGAPQSGFGALWFADTAAYTAAALLLAGHRRAWTALVAWAAVVATAVAAVKALDYLSLRNGGGHLLIFVASYYGWLALALPLTAAHDPAPPRPLAWALAAIAAAVAVASQSLTVVGLFALGAAMLAAGWRWPRLATLLTPRRAILLVLAAAALPWLALHGIPLLLAKESLRDRALVQTLVQAAVAADPWALLAGHGWGRTQDAFHTWLNLSGEQLWDPTWIFLKSDYFHSHNWGLEALYSAGLPGFLLALAGFAAIPLYACAERRVAATALAVAMVLFSGLWFQLSLSGPLTALALAGLADRSAWPARVPARPLAAAVVLMATAQAAAAGLLLHHGLSMTRARAAWNAPVPAAMAPPADFRGSDLGAAEAIQSQLAAYARRGDPRTAPAIRAMLEFIDRRAAGTRTVMLLTTGLGAMAQIHVTGELPFAAEPGDMDMWKSWLHRLLDVAPGRGDQAIPYLTASLSQGRLDRVAETSNRLLAADGNDPVGLYYRGLGLVVQPDPARKAEGLDAIRRALRAGLERFMPIDPALKKTLTGS